MYINKEDFLKCINKTNIDREYYHEIKTNLDLSEFCESFEAPSILNIRQHYYPSRTILIRKRNAVYAKPFHVPRGLFEVLLSARCPVERGSLEARDRWSQGLGRTFQWVIILAMIVRRPRN